MRYIYLLAIFFLFIKSTLAFAGPVPNRLIPEFEAAVQKQIIFSCEDEFTPMVCQQFEGQKNGYCYLDTEAKSCAVMDKQKNIVNNLTINQKKLSQVRNEVQKYKTSKEIFSIEDSFFQKTLQTQTYSCELSAMGDILSTIKDKKITENELIAGIGKSWFAREAKEVGGIMYWGNPNKGFVGYIDTDAEGEQASQRRMTGYGVYEQPLADLYKRYGVETKIINDTHHSLSYTPREHLGDLLNEIEKGNFVQVWGDVCTDPAYEDGELDMNEVTQADIDAGKNAKNNCWSWGTDRNISWYYEENGAYVKNDTIIGEHNFYLLGYQGEKENPNHILLWDTATGYHKYDIKEFMRKWSTVDYRSLIVYAQ